MKRLFTLIFSILILSVVVFGTYSAVWLYYQNVGQQTGFLSFSVIPLFLKDCVLCFPEILKALIIVVVVTKLIIHGLIKAVTKAIKDLSLPYNVFEVGKKYYMTQDGKLNTESLGKYIGIAVNKRQIEFGKE